MPKVIGTGTYGCVVKPSLKCTTSQDYKNRVSKVMNKEDAMDEYAEMEKISKIKDIEKYAIRLPVMCSPNPSPEFHKTMKQCKNTRVQNALKYGTDRVRLLLLDDGGVDLNVFLSSIMTTLNNADQKKFFTAILQLFKGLSFFRENEMIHHDIKLPNIVYNVNTGKMKYIDFGLLEMRKRFIQKSKLGLNEYAISWAYFPNEYSCANQDSFSKEAKCTKYHTHSYDTFINKIADTFDGFCLTLALKPLFLASSKRLDSSVFSKDFFVGAHKLMSEYCDADVYKRNDDFVSLYNRYKLLLQKYNLYDISQPTPSQKSRELSEKYSIVKTNIQETDKDKTKAKLESVVKSKTKPKPKPKPTNKTVKKPKPKSKRELKPCPPGQERNPATNRCRKIRSPIQTAKKPPKRAPSRRSLKPCPPGKVRNPKTNRCITVKNKPVGT